MRQRRQGRAAPAHRFQHLQDPARCFLYDRNRLTDLSRCGWESLKTYFTSCSRHSDSLPGAVIAIQTFGDLLGYNPHLHVLISDGCFHKSEMLTVAPAIDTHALEQLFRHKILKLLLSQGRITEATVALMAKWRYSGFSVHLRPADPAPAAGGHGKPGALHHPGLVFPGASGIRCPICHILGQPCGWSTITPSGNRCPSKASSYSLFRAAGPHRHPLGEARQSGPAVWGAG